MAESDTWTAFKKLAAPLDPVRIENLLGKGTPDVELIGSWVELKWLPCFPARANTVVRIDHYTDEQRSWLLRRWNMGGPAYLVLQVRSEWFFFTAPEAQQVGYLTQAELKGHAKLGGGMYFGAKPSSKQVCDLLTRPIHSIAVE